MGEAEKQEVCARIISIIEDDYHQRLTSVYATTVALAEKQPEQVNNEIRNALNHIARALDAPTKDAADAEIRLSIAHLERGIRDCLKLSIVYIREKLDSMVLAVEFIEGSLPIAYKKRLSDLGKERRKALRAESKGEQGVTDIFVNLLNDCFDLETEILNTYAYVGKWRGWLFRALARTRNKTTKIVTGIILLVLSALVGIEITHHVGAKAPSEFFSDLMTSSETTLGGQNSVH